MTPSGWPRLVIYCIGKDWWGNEYVKAYGSTFVPTEPGNHICNIRMYSPIESGTLMEYFGFTALSDGLTSLIDNP